MFLVPYHSIAAALFAVSCVFVWCVLFVQVACVCAGREGGGVYHRRVCESFSYFPGLVSYYRGGTLFL